MKNNSRKKSFLFVYGYSNVNGGFNGMINSYGAGLMEKGYDIFVLSHIKDYKGRGYTQEKNGFKVYYTNTRNLLKLIFHHRVLSVCFFEPFLSNLLVCLFIKIIKPSVDTTLYGSGTRTEHKSIFEKILLRLGRFTFINNLIAGSEYAKSKFFEGENVKMPIIYGPIEPELYTCTNGLNDKRLMTLDVIRERKNYLDLIEAFRYIHEADNEITLEIIGDYKKIYDRSQKKEYAKKVFKKVKEYNLEKYIIFHGDVSEEKKRKLLSTGSVYIKTSSHEMGGLATTEAAASGLPLVAFDNTGTHELLNSMGGILVPDKDPKALANAVLGLINDKEKLKSLSRKSLEGVKRYSLKRSLTDFNRIVLAKSI
jgi:glycosyltransferase involved in cell wall biosynthesis